MTAKVAKPSFSKTDHETWRRLFNNQTPLRTKQIIPEFQKGLDLLGMTEDAIPDIDKVNRKLKKLTGWEGVPVTGFEGPETFYVMLAKKQFPIGAFIRDIKDLSYTPAPDVFHDLYGHIPFYTIPAYAEFCEEFGVRSSRHLNSESKTLGFQRFFWFTCEFGMIKTSQGRKVFGSGITSSFSECAYALSDKPKVVPFNIEKIVHQDFRIDILQSLLFELENVDQLYNCLDDLEKAV